MISAIILAADTRASSDLGYMREVVVRSLVWLVSAVVSSVVRDVTLATPMGLGLSEVADQSGCNLVQAETEAGRLKGAIEGCRTDRLLVVQAGYEPDGRLIEELDSFIRRNPSEAIALVRAAPTTAIQRLLPNRAPVIGLLLPRVGIMGPYTFAGLRAANRRGTTLRTRAVPIV